MFSASKDYSTMKTQDILKDVVEELDAIKRYAANTYANTDTEISEMMSIMKRVEIQLRETDNQIDRIERFERTLNEIKSSLKQIERKVR